MIYKYKGAPEGSRVPYFQFKDGIKRYIIRNTLGKLEFFGHSFKYPTLYGDDWNYEPIGDFTLEELKLYDLL